MKKAVFAFLIPIGVLFAQSGAIGGRVVAYQGYDPVSVKGAGVYAVCDSSGYLIDEGEALTDDDGMYRIEDLESGIYRVQVSKDEFYTVSYPERVRVIEGTGSYGINFALTAFSPFDSANYFSGEVRLLDYYGDDWGGVVTTFSYRGYVMAEDSLIPLTDTLGAPLDIAEYLIDTIPSEPLFLVAHVGSYLPQYYDHTYEIQEYSGIIPSRDSVDFDLERGNDTALIGGISGIISGEHGPLPLASVYVIDDEQVVSGCMTVDDGSYWLPLQPGVYDVYATRAGYYRSDYFEPVTVADEEVPGVDIQLHPWDPQVGIEENPEIKVVSLGVAPNPFTTSTTITYSLSRQAHVSIKLYDISGSIISTLQDENTSAGEHHLTWDGRDAQHQPLASGVYFCRIVIDNHTLTRPLVLIR